MATKVRVTAPLKAADAPALQRSVKADLNGLQVFDAVMAEMNMTRAAVRLYMTPSAVSHAVGRLRVALEDELFVRTSTGVRPTKRAVELWAAIDGPMRALQAAMGKDIFEASNARFTISISLNDMLARLLGPGLIELFSRLAPKAELSLRQRRPLEDDARIRVGLLDFAIGAALSKSSDLKYRELWQDDYVCMYRSDHPSGPRLSRELQIFLGQTHIAVIPDGETPATADLALRDLGHQPARRVVVGTFSSVPDILCSTDCIALMPSAYAPHFQRHYPQLRAGRPPVPLKPLQYHLVWHERTERNRARGWALTQLSAFLQDEAPALLRGASELPVRATRKRATPRKRA